MPQISSLFSLVFVDREYSLSKKRRYTVLLPNPKDERIDVECKIHY